MERIVEAPDVPAIDAYGRAVVAGDLRFTAGRIPPTPDGEPIDDGSPEVRARRSPENAEVAVDTG